MVQERFTPDQLRYLANEAIKDCRDTDAAIFTQAADDAERLAQAGGPVLLWRAPTEPRPEPVAILSYGSMKYAVPYTMIGIMAGFLTMGGEGSSWKDAMTNVVNALSCLSMQMSRDANPLTKSEIDFYKSHGILTEPRLPVVTDFSAAHAPDDKEKQ